MKTKFLLLLFAFLLISCQRSLSDNEAEEVDFFEDSDFPAEKMFDFIEKDLKSQTRQEYFNFVFDDEPLNEQEKILFLGAWSNEILERYQLNLFEEKFVFTKPPNSWMSKESYKNFPMIYVPLIVSTENKNIFFAELKVEGREHKYIFLAVKNEGSEWDMFLTGSVMTEEEMDEIIIKILGETLNRYIYKSTQIAVSVLRTLSSKKLNLSSIQSLNS